ncbi:MAG: alpha-amylase family protein [Cytophagaceae bacterium]
MKNWYKNAIIYKLDVESFYDGNGDGIGDFNGLKKKLPHLAGLGIDCIWLLPFYPTPNRDNGYDIQDYYNIDPRLGTLGDFVDFVHRAGEYGMKVLIDLVINHTSIEHPWFQESRKDPNGKFRDYYIWVKEPNRDHKEKVIFEGVEHSIWEYDKEAEAYYLHHFFKEQPDLNIANENVQNEILKIMGFWLELGIAGFRIDAAHILTETTEQVHDEKESLHNILNKIREFQINRKSSAILMGEANVVPEKLKEYFGDKDRLQLLFNFMANKNLFLSLAREEAEPLYKTFEQLLDVETAEWVNFIRHHDELNLEYLTDSERKEVFKAFAPDDNMKIFGHGIRRRLPPMLHGDKKRIALTYSLMFSLKGIPLISYGEEIGMGDDLSLEGRTSVRTPMQWSDAKNGGFSTAKKEVLIHPVIDNGSYGYQKVNVMNQLSHPESLLNWMEKLIRTRKKCPEFGHGEWNLLKVDDKEIFACCAEHNEGTVICLHNLSYKPITTKIHNLKSEGKKFIDIFGDKVYKECGENHEFELSGYGYRWIRVYDFS